jgi:hypothetical protein
MWTLCLAREDVIGGELLANVGINIARCAPFKQGCVPTKKLLIKMKRKMIEGMAHDRGRA